MGKAVECWQSQARKCLNPVNVVSGVTTALFKRRKRGWPWLVNVLRLEFTHKVTLRENINAIKFLCKFRLCEKNRHNQEKLKELLQRALKERNVEAETHIRK